MDTYRLRQFCVIAETGSLTKAAELMFITHSGLSKSMKLLQDELGFALLRPSGRGLALTDEGMRIYKNAKEFLALEDKLFTAKKQPQLQTLKIGAVEIFLLPLCEQIKRLKLPNYSLTLLDLNPGQIEQLIVTKQLDYGITYAPYPMENIEIIEAGQYQLGCFHLFGRFKDLKIHEIPFAVPAQGLSDNPLGIKERDGWLESMTPRNKQYYVNLLSTALDLTRQGLCAVYIPRFIANLLNRKQEKGMQLIEHPLPKTHKKAQTAYLLKHKDKPKDALFMQLKTLVQTLIHQ